MCAKTHLLIPAVLMRMAVIQIERQANIIATIKTRSAPKYHAMFLLVIVMVAVATAVRVIETTTLENA
jgi:hypothetical protein